MRRLASAFSGVWKSGKAWKASCLLLLRLVVLKVVEVVVEGRASKLVSSGEAGEHVELSPKAAASCRTPRRSLLLRIVSDEGGGQRTLVHLP